jgi:hypothetical protein
LSGDASMLVSRTRSCRSWEESGRSAWDPTSSAVPPSINRRMPEVLRRPGVQVLFPYMKKSSS